MFQLKLLLFLWLSLWTVAVPVPETATQGIVAQVQKSAQSGEIESSLEETANKQQKNEDRWLLDIPLSYEMQRYTYIIAQDAGISPAVLFAIMEHESGYQPDAVGYNANGTVDIGLMQINSCNWGWLADEGIDVHTPEGNVQAAVKILQIYTARYPIEQALACYAAGESGMKSGGGTAFAEAIMERSGQMEAETQKKEETQ